MVCPFKKATPLINHAIMNVCGIITCDDSASDAALSCATAREFPVVALLGPPSSRDYATLRFGEPDHDEMSCTLIKANCVEESCLIQRSV